MAEIEEEAYLPNDALLDGARYGELEEIEQALAEGADINYQDVGGNSGKRAGILCIDKPQHCTKRAPTTIWMSLSS